MKLKRDYSLKLESDEDGSAIRPALPFKLKSERPKSLTT
jgi:hypothetical protein